MRGCLGDDAKMMEASSGTPTIHDATLIPSGVAVHGEGQYVHDCLNTTCING